MFATGFPNKPLLCAVVAALLLLLLPNKPPVDALAPVLIVFPKLPFGALDPVELLPNNPVELVGFTVELLFPNKLPAFLEVALLAPPNNPPDGCVGLFPNSELLGGCWLKVLEFELALNKPPEGLGVEVFALALAFPNNPVDFWGN